jgi:FkbM family methyltransferase
MINDVIQKIKKISRRFHTSHAPASYMEVERAEQTFYINYLREGMAVFDIGANVGEISLLFSRFVGNSGSVHSFEASSNTFDRLEKVCSLANRKQIILNRAAVAEKVGFSSLHVYDDSHSAWNSLAARPLEKYGIDVKPIQVEKVQTVTIDSYCRENNIPQIDLMKIDVEGAEYQVLQGASRMLEAKSIGCCVFEFGATTFDMGNTPDQIESLLRKYGYRIWNVVQGDPPFPGRSSAAEACFSVHIAMPLL